jgi:hypothetical protein
VNSRRKIIATVKFKRQPTLARIPYSAIFFLFYYLSAFRECALNPFSRQYESCLSI